MENVQIKEVVFEAIKRLNEQLSKSEQLKIAEGTLLSGGETPLDSLAVVNLTVSIEELIESRSGQYISLLDETAMLSSSQSPFHSVETLIRYIEDIFRSKLR